VARLLQVKHVLQHSAVPHEIDGLHCGRSQVRVLPGALVRGGFHLHWKCLIHHLFIVYGGLTTVLWIRSATSGCSRPLAM
jgi:hypothetical protein